jgi:hypothetical protein
LKPSAGLQLFEYIENDYHDQRIAMNYYEELGIRPDADEEEIRKAHRRLVKLMHPDQHRDAGLKQLAETQMRRLNSIVATLLDPEERADYDDELRGVDLPGQTANQSTWRSVPWWIASTLGAIVLTVGAVWFWADRIGSSFSTHTPTVVENPDTPAAEKQPVTPPPAPPTTGSTADTRAKPDNAGDRSAASTTVTPVPVPNKTANAMTSAPPPVADPKSSAPPLVASSPKASIQVPPPAKEQPPAAKSPDLAARKMAPSYPLTKPVQPERTAKIEAPPKIYSKNKIDGKKKLSDLPIVAKVEAPKQVWDNKLQAPGTSGLDSEGHDNLGLVAVNGNPSLPRPPDFNRTPANASRDPLEGEWVYAPTEPEKRKAGLYPPEFINLKLIKEPDGMRGQYSARYNVADSRPISPDVNFALKSVDKTSRKYVWTASDGSHGTFVIRSLETDTMRLEWKTTSLRGGPALTSGMATLVRRMN